MSANGLPVFDTTLQHTHAWLKDLSVTLERGDRHHAWYVLTCVLHAIRDRLGTEEVAHLGAQMPLLVRGMYYDGWRPAKPKPARGTFLLDLERQFRDEWHDDPLWYSRAVFDLLRKHITPGELEDVRHALPEDVRALWDAPPVSG
jgi:uncharacterized protein (DUF2267 family)